MNHSYEIRYEEDEIRPGGGWSYLYRPRLMRYFIDDCEVSPEEFNKHVVFKDGKFEYTIRDISLDSSPVAPVVVDFNAVGHEKLVSF